AYILQDLQLARWRAYTTMKLAMLTKPGFAALGPETELCLTVMTAIRLSRPGTPSAAVRREASALSAMRLKRVPESRNSGRRSSRRARSIGSQRAGARPAPEWAKAWRVL